MNTKRTNKPRMRPATRLFSLLLLAALVLTLVPMALANGHQAWTVVDFVGLEGEAGIAGSGNRMGATINAPAAPDDVLIFQPPDQTTGIFSDTSCDFCSSGIQSIAEDFVLSTDGTIYSISIWGIYFDTDTLMPDNWTVIFHADTGAGPGVALNTQTNVPTSLIVIGDFFGYTEYQYTLTLDTPVPLNAGSYWVEIYTDTGYGTDDWAWETGTVDSTSGRPGFAYAFETPGTVWATDPSLDLSIQVDFTPTAVDLASFSTAAQGSAILLEWETATELDNLGFNLYRSTAAEGVRLQLNAALIPARNPGTPLGATYGLTDDTAAPGVPYYYWLEDVDANGAATLHGRVSGQVEPLRRLLPARPRFAPVAPTFHSR